MQAVQSICSGSEPGIGYQGIVHSLGFVKSERNRGVAFLRACLSIDGTVLLRVGRTITVVEGFGYRFEQEEGQIGA